jgi:hypothetical protein
VLQHINRIPLVQGNEGQVHPLRDIQDGRINREPENFFQFGMNRVNFTLITSINQAVQEVITDSIG